MQSSDPIVSLQEERDLSQKAGGTSTRWDPHKHNGNSTFQHSKTEAGKEYESVIKRIFAVLLKMNFKDVSVFH